METLTDTIQIYTVSARHPSKDLGYDVELIATSEKLAISRVRGTLFHKDRDVEWLDGDYTITDVQPFTSAAARS